MEEYILTADIGGAHITTAVYQRSTRTAVKPGESRVELRSKGAANDILGAWAFAFADVLKKTNISVTGLAVAMPGPFDYGNGISYIKGLNKYDALYGMDIRTHFSGLLNLKPENIRFRNDAEAAIAGEALAGAGRGLDNVLGITLGTGFGSAHYQNTVTRDLNLGSVPYKNSIADDHFSTRWFLKRYFELTGISVTSVKELAELTKINQRARLVFKEFAINLGDFLTDHLSQLNPEALLITGNIARSSELFLTELKKRLGGRPILVGKLGENAALAGAADLFTGDLNN